MQQIHAAFGRGDIPCILAQSAEDVDWEHDKVAPVPWRRPRKGRAQVPALQKA